MITVRCNIYEDVLTMLFEKTDIKKDIEKRIRNDDWVIDQIIEKLDEKYGDNVEGIINRIISDDISATRLIDYITYDNQEITFDYNGTINSGDRRNVAFLVPLHFNDEKFIKEVAK